VNFYQGDCESLILPTGDGVYGVQAGHNPVLVALHMGIAKFTVNGETADWDKDAAWWCLTDASGEMTAVGVADIQLHDGDSYAFTYTK